MRITRIVFLVISLLGYHVSNAAHPDDWFIEGSQVWLQSIEKNPMLEKTYRISPDLLIEKLDRKAFAFANFTNGYVLGMLKMSGFAKFFPCKKGFEHTTEVITRLALWIQNNPDKVRHLWNGQIVSDMLSEIYLCEIGNER